MYSDIIRTIHTKHDLGLLQQEIHELKNALFNTDKSVFDKALTNTVRLNIAQEIKEDLRKNSIDPSTFLQGLEKELEQLRIVTITFAFEPTQRFIDYMYTWLHANAGDSIVVDIQYDITIIGGIIIAFEGKYRDFSLRKKIDEYFELK